MQSILGSAVKLVGLQGSNRFDGGEANNPDIVVMDKKERRCLVIDIARLLNTRISEGKLEKDQYLKRELKRIWKCKEALGALGIVSTSLRKWLQVLDVAKELLRAATEVMLLGNS